MRDCSARSPPAATSTGALASYMHVGQGLAVSPSVRFGDVGAQVAGMTRANGEPVEVRQVLDEALRSLGQGYNALGESRIRP